MRRLLPLAAIALAGCVDARGQSGADRDAAEMAEALAGRTAGRPERCISASSTDGPRVIGQSLIYRDGGRLYRTDAVDGCPSLRDDQIVIVEIYGGQLCQNDRFRTIDRGSIGIPGPYCRFGPFIPYSRPK